MTRLLSVRENTTSRRWYVHELDNELGTPQQLSAQSLASRAEGISNAVYVGNRPTIANVVQPHWRLISVIDVAETNETLLFFDDGR